MNHPNTRLRLGSVLFVAAGTICLALLVLAAADAWLQFQETRGFVSAELGRMP